MKKLLLIFFLLFATIASAQKYTATDTIKTTLSTSRYTSVSLGSGDKTIHLQNTATSVLLIGFSNGRDLADTVNIYRLNPGNWIHFYERVAKYMYLFTGAADAITTTISYGSGLDYLIERTDANGVTVTNPVRDTITYRDTLTETTSFKTYNFGSQYELITITLTKNDTCAVIWDSVKFYSVSSYGDTALTGVRYTSTFTDSSFVRVNWSAGTRTSSQKVLFLDPICKFLHIRLENFALTNRSVILTIRGAKK